MDRVTYPKSMDISAMPSIPNTLRNTMRGVKMKKIDVSTPKYPDTFALVDDKDYSALVKHKWTAVKFRNSSTLYVFRGWKGSRQYMHTVILGEKKGLEVDHRDNNGLNNCRDNLRHCTHAQNMQNRKIQGNNRSGYKGVFWCKREKRWIASIGVQGKQITLGRFFCLIKAAKVYDTAARKYHGEYANTNFARFNGES